VLEMLSAAETCPQVEARADLYLENGLPKAAQAELAPHQAVCRTRIGFSRRLDDATQRVRESDDHIAMGQQWLLAGRLDQASHALERAIEVDSQSVGAESLRQAILSAESSRAPTFEPPVERGQPSFAPANTTSDTAGIAQEFIRDAKNALMAKNYAEAKSSARSALRIAPGNTSAEALLRQAEAEEQQALQNIIIN